VSVRCSFDFAGVEPNSIRRKLSQRLTNVDMFQSSQIQGGTDDICRPFREQDVPAIVALLHRLQDIRRVVGLEIIVAFDNTLLVTFRRTVHLLVWPLWRVNQRWSAAFMRTGAAGVVALYILLVGSPGGEGARGLEESEDQ
jgi:hypothetical protein